MLSIAEKKLTANGFILLKEDNFFATITPYK